MRNERQSANYTRIQGLCGFDAYEYQIKKQNTADRQHKWETMEQKGKAQIEKISNVCKPHIYGSAKRFRTRHERVSQKNKLTIPAMKIKYPYNVP